uniref:Uncharacterized protein n=1 Tax=Setaria italica TaxID=4555 RepID=K3YBK7_SETIT
MNLTHQHYGLQLWSNSTSPAPMVSFPCMHRTILQEAGLSSQPQPPHKNARRIFVER